MLRILHRDDHLIAIDKPAGIATVPGRNDKDPALIVEVREIAPGAMAVHRLDRDTSGVVLFALTRDAHRALNAAFEARRVEKTYLALVRGDVPARRRVDLPLADTRRGGMRVAERGEKGALAALTEVRPEERFGAYTLCTCLPRTGRTHQIRVHLAAIGHPLAIDPRYGEERPLRIGELWSGSPDPDTIVLTRTPLHASSLRVPHPARRGWLSVEAPVPDDIARCLDLLRAARRSADVGPLV
ncbi:MAG TPA: RluA family pseudouridine synthase [Myxococcales bacterium]|nr:RluA family pseudouridine synthase [Myxococcales bacterium]